MRGYRLSVLAGMLLLYGMSSQAAEVSLYGSIDTGLNYVHRENGIQRLHRNRFPLRDHEYRPVCGPVDRRCFRYCPGYNDEVHVRFTHRTGRELLDIHHNNDRHILRHPDSGQLLLPAGDLLQQHKGAPS